MKRDFIPGRDIDGEWTVDEDGELRRAQAISERDFAAIEPLPFNAGMLDDLEAQMLRDHLDTIEQTSAIVAHIEDVQTNAGKALDASDAVGLVSVLSTQKRPSPSLQRPHARVPFRVSAERTAAVQAAGAFVAGGDEARMAKLRMAVGFAARAHGALRPGHRPDEARMVTLTYADAKGWRANHVRSYMDHVRKWHSARGIKCRYVWIAEIQDGSRRKDGGARGAVHYHVLLWVPVGTVHMPKSDLQGWWPHGATRTEKAEKAASYICSYLKKANSKNFKDFPDGCRIYSVGGLEHSLRRARRWLGLPSFVQANSSYADDWRRAQPGTGGGWIDPSGQHWPSEFRRVSIAGVHALQRVHTHARSIEASGPFAWLADRASATVRQGL